MRACGSPASRSRNAAVSRDLPMPASPESSTTWPSPAFALAQRRSRSSLSSSRPTSAVSPPACSASNRLSCELALSAAKARVGPATPLRSCGPRSSSSNRLPSSLRVPSAMTTLSGSAIALQPRGEVRRVADDAALLRLPRTQKIADDHDPRRDARPAHAAARPRRFPASAQPRRSRARPSPRAPHHARAPADSRNRRARRRPCTWRRSRRCAAIRLAQHL